MDDVSPPEVISEVRSDMKDQVADFFVTQWSALLKFGNGWVLSFLTS